MSPECIKVALDAAVVANKLWHDLIASNALGNDFMQQPALGVTNQEHGWVSPWNVEESLTAFPGKAQKYQGSVNAKLLKRCHTGSKTIDFTKCQMAKDQFFDHTRGRANVDMPIIFFSHLQAIDDLPRDTALDVEKFPMAGGHEMVYGLVMGAWLCFQAGGDMGPYVRSFRSVVVCALKVAEGQHNDALKKLQYGQDELAKFDICSDSILDESDHYLSMTKGLKDAGKKTTHEAVVEFASGITWHNPKNKWTVTNVKMNKLVANFYLEDKDVHLTLRKFNLNHTQAVLCRGAYHLDAIKQFSQDVSWIPKIIDMLDFMLLRQQVTAEKITITNLRGKALSKDNQQPVIGYTSLIVVKLLIIDAVFSVEGLNMPSEVEAVFRDGASFSECYPSQLEIQRLNRGGFVMRTHAVRAKINDLNETQTRACEIGEKVWMAVLDKPIKELWNTTMRGDINKNNILQAISSCETLKDNWCELKDSLQKSKEDALATHVSPSNVSIAAMVGADIGEPSGHAGDVAVDPETTAEQK